MKLTVELLRKLIRAVRNSRPDEIGCDDCFEELHKFAELELAGKSPEEAFPLVQDHLERCGECQQEYEGLLKAMGELKKPA